MNIVCKQTCPGARGVAIVISHAGVMKALQFGLKLKSIDHGHCAILHLQYDVENRVFTQVCD